MPHDAVKLAVLEAELDAHMKDDAKTHSGLGGQITEFKRDVRGWMEATDKRFDQFDSKLWAIVVMVAIGLLIYAAQEFLK